MDPPCVLKGRTDDLRSPGDLESSFAYFFGTMSRHLFSMCHIFLKWLFPTRKLISA